MRLITGRFSLYALLIAVASAILASCAGTPTPAPAPSPLPTVVPVATAAPASPTAGTSPSATVQSTPGPTAVVPTAPPSPTPIPTATPGPSPTPVTVPTSTTETVLKVAANPQLGNILTDAQGMTLYTFKNDGPDKSNCTGDCATLWPPLTIGFNVTPAGAAGVTGSIGVLERPDGKYQIWYNDAPLYRYSKDIKPGDTNGNGLNGLWSVVVIPAQTATPAATGAPSGTPTATK